MLPLVPSTIVPPGCSAPDALGRVDDRDAEPVLDAGGGVVELELREHRGAGAVGHAVELHERRRAEGLGDGRVDASHALSLGRRAPRPAGRWEDRPRMTDDRSRPPGGARPDPPPWDPEDMPGPSRRCTRSSTGSRMSRSPSPRSAAGYDTAGEEAIAVRLLRARPRRGPGRARTSAGCYLQHGSTLQNLGRLDESLRVLEDARDGSPGRSSAPRVPRAVACTRQAVRTPRSRSSCCSPPTPCPPRTSSATSGRSGATRRSSPREDGPGT